MFVIASLSTHILHIPLTKRMVGRGGELGNVISFQVRCENILDVHIWSEFHDYVAYVNLTTIFYKVFSPSSLLNCCDSISRTVVDACKSWKNKRKQWWTWQDTVFNRQTKTLSSIWNKWKKNRLSSNLHCFFKSSIHISSGNSFQMIYRICEIQL